jgi:aspartate aminotransferase
MKKLSSAAHRLKGQAMFQILAHVRELEKQGQDILHFELGDPDFETPEHIVEAAYAALKKGETHYAPSAGLADLKQISADVTLRSRGFKPDPNQLLVCAGANVMIYYAIACSVEAGEEILVPDPGFVSYFSIIDFLGIKPVRIPLQEKNLFRLDPDDIEKAITPKTRMIIINSPSNPTGAMMTPDEIKRVYQIAEKHDVYLLSDEIYARMVYDDSNTKFSSPSAFDHCRERTIVVNGFSKSYAMTGWRLGVMTGPAGLVEKMGLLLETTSSCVSPFVQRAGIEALTGSQKKIKDMVLEYRRRRDLMVRGLNELPGVSCVKPEGAFYVFPNIRQTGLSSDEFTDFVLREAGVAVTPGNVFGRNGEGYVRLCYVNSMPNIEKALMRMKSALEKLKENKR